jgi:hypothetical protein
MISFLFVVGNEKVKLLFWKERDKLTSKYNNPTKRILTTPFSSLTVKNPLLSSIKQISEKIRFLGRFKTDSDLEIGSSKVVPPRITVFYL